MKYEKVIIRDSENEASRIFLERMKDEVRKCGTEVFVSVDGTWVSDPRKVDEFLIARCLDMNFFRLNARGKEVEYSSKLRWARAIMRAMKARIPDDPKFRDSLNDG